MFETPAKQGLISHLPKFIVARAARGEEVTQPFVAPMPGVALVLDIAGFVPLTEEFTRQGRGGAERLSSLLNAYFGHMTGIVDACGGDVIAFTGDGFVAIWVNSASIEADALLAARCGLEIQRALPALEAELGVGLRQRVIIGVGEVLLGAVGGVGGRFHPVAGGSALSEVTHHYPLAESGEVLLCPTAYRVLASGCDAAAKAAQTAILRDVAASLPPRVPAPWLSPAIETKLDCFLPPVMVNRVRAGQAAWLAEFRNITVLFVGLPRFGAPRAGDLALLQTATEIVQSVILPARGDLDRVAVEEKGVCYLLEFGLPSMAHQDDALRAVRAGLTLCEELRALGVEPSIGVTTGKLFCGSYGGAERQTYSVIGASVNLAARLMEHALGAVLCDEATRGAVAGSIAFAAPERVRLKGIRDPVLAHAALRVHREQPRGFAPVIVGRERERAILQRRVAAVEAGGLLLLEGEAGIGKSRLLEELAEAAGALGVAVAAAAGAEIEQATPYFPWRSVLRQILGGGEAAALRQMVEALLEDEIALGRVALLNDILPLGFAETDVTREITGAARSSLTQQLLAEILAQKAHEAPFVLVLDDAHWCDGPSASVLDKLLRGAPPILFVLATRPLGGNVPQELVQLAEREECERLILGLLPRAAVEDLVACKLGVAVVPRPLVDFVFERAGGNPLYSEELTLALRAFGFIEVEGDACRLPETGFDGVELAIPDTLQGAIVSRTDRLAAAEQLTLKVASVIGRRFSTALLRELYPIDEDLQRLDEILDRLMVHDFVWRDKGSESTEYLFKHVIVQEVVYDLLLLYQRQSLHHQIALSLEATRASGIEVSFSELATHWERAGAVDNAMRYLALAGDLALRRYSIREVVTHCRKAVSLVGQHRLELPSSDRARWSAMLADAHQELFDYEAAGTYFKEALTLLSWPVPRTGIGLAWRIAREVATQLRLRVAIPATPRGERHRFAAHIYERLAEIAYFDSRRLELLFGTLASLNRAEEAASLRETVDGYAALSIGLSAAGLRRLAGFYNHRSLELAERAGAISDIAYAHLVNMVYCAALGRWDAVEQSGERAAALFLSLGAATRWQQVQATLCFARFTRGAADLAAPILAELETAIRERDTPAQVSAWVAAATININAAHGRFEPASADSARRLAGDPAVHRADRLLCLGLAALVELRCGNAAAALELADQGLVTVTQSEPTAWHLTSALCGLAETFLVAAEGGGLPGHRRETLELRARAACAALRRYSWRIPVAEPSALMMNARYAAHSGRHASARRRRAQALRAALRYDIEAGSKLGLEPLAVGSVSGLARAPRGFFGRFGGGV
jgi:class 3 adenylate cyclase